MVRLSLEADPSLEAGLNPGQDPNPDPDPDQGAGLDLPEADRVRLSPEADLDLLNQVYIF